MRLLTVAVAALLAATPAANAAEAPVIATPNANSAFFGPFMHAYEASTGAHLGITFEENHESYLALSRGQVLAAGVDRPPMGDEIGIATSAAAWDALALLIHPSNPVKSLSSEQLRSIYQGVVTNWAEVGGPNLKICPYMQDGEGTALGYAVRETLFAGMRPVWANSIRYFRSIAMLDTEVRASPCAIAFTTWGFARNGTLGFVAVDNVSVSRESVANGTYPLSYPVFLAVSLDQEGEALSSFLYAEAALDAIRRAGGIPYVDALNLVSKQLERRLSKGSGSPLVPRGGK